MTKRKRKPRRERDLDRVERALKRWQAAVDAAPTTAARCAAAWDMHRAASQMAAELAGVEVADIYMDAAAKGLVGNAADLCNELLGML